MDTPTLKVKHVEATFLSKCIKLNKTGCLYSRINNDTYVVGQKVHSFFWKWSYFPMDWVRCGILSGCWDRFAGRTTLSPAFTSVREQTSLREERRLRSDGVNPMLDEDWGVTMGGLTGLGALLLLSGGLGALGQGEEIVLKCLCYGSSKCLCWKSRIRTNSDGLNLNFPAISFT